MRIQQVFLNVVWLCALSGSPALAEEGHGPERAAQSHDMVLDHRYNHDRYYPPRGYVVHVPPPAYYVSQWHGAPYYFRGGVWYRPSGPGWVVVTPPLGLVLPILPPFYTTVWFGAVPYYYANDTYYSWRPEEQGYQVVAPPQDNTAPSTQPPSDELYVYPSNGQSAEQQSKDKYECHRWASSQSGFDPTLPQGGVAPERVADLRAAYQRAMSACLTARGYSVR
jgi:hypothetical protein